LRELNHFGRAWWYAVGIFSVVVGILGVISSAQTVIGVAFAIVTIGAGLDIVQRARSIAAD
jgi:hypothetical protein